MKPLSCLLAVALLVVLWAPTASADSGPNPHTCASNTQAAGIFVSAFCQEPSAHPCLARVQAKGHHAEVCDV